MQQSLAPRRGRLLVRRLMIVVVVALSAAIFASPASAGQPTPWAISGMTATGPTSGCSRPVLWSAKADVTGIDFFDANNKLTRQELHWLQQDTYSANEKTLVSTWYRYNTQITFDSLGTPTLMSSGQLGRIRLPDGSLFVMAGRFEVLWVPTVSPPGLKGNPGNLAAFCAALGLGLAP